MTGLPLSSATKLFWPPYRADVPERPSEPRFAAGTAYVDGEIVPIEEACIPLLDWGFLRSDACQETISVWDGAFFRLDDHLVRCGIPVSYTNVFRGGRSEIKPSEISPKVHREWMAKMGGTGVPSPARA